MSGAPRTAPFDDAVVLESGAYAGVRCDGRLVAAAGAHVVSARRGVAAIGNVAVAPRWRCKRLGRAVTAFVASRLRARVPRVGLNVHAANLPALHCYRALGFVPVLAYQQRTFERGTLSPWRSGPIGSFPG